MNYLDKNKAYWEQGYNSPSVDHPVFRFHGRILRPEFGLGGRFEKLVDFGCGQGAAVSFFHQQGFNARGADISETDIAVAKIRYPHIAQNFAVCAPEPKANEYYGFAEDVAVVTAIQSLYYFSDHDFQECVHADGAVNAVAKSSDEPIPHRKTAHESRQYEKKIKPYSISHEI